VELAPNELYTKFLIFVFMCTEKDIVQKCMELKGAPKNSRAFHNPTRSIFRLIGEILVDNQRSRDLPVGHASVVSPQMRKSAAYKTLQNITESIDVEKALNSSRPEHIHNLAASVICVTTNRRNQALNPMTDITDEQMKKVYMQMDLGRVDKSSRCNLRFELLSPTVISPDSNVQSTPLTTQETNTEDDCGSNYLDFFQDINDDEESESTEDTVDDKDSDKDGDDLGGDDQENRSVGDVNESESKEDIGDDKDSETIVAKPKSGTNVTDTYADTIARIFGENDPVMRDIEQIPWKYLWLLLRRKNWKWDFGIGHSNCYFAPGYDVKCKDAVWGVHKFDSDESVRRFVQKQNWPEFSPSAEEVVVAEATNQVEEVIATTTKKRKRVSVSVAKQKRRRSSGKNQTKQKRKTISKQQKQQESLLQNEASEEEDEQNEDEQTSSSTGAECEGEGQIIEAQLEESLLQNDGNIIGDVGQEATYEMYETRDTGRNARFTIAYLPDADLGNILRQTEFDRCKLAHRDAGKSLEQRLNTPASIDGKLNFIMDTLVRIWFIIYFVQTCVWSCRRCSTWQSIESPCLSLSILSLSNLYLSN